MPGMHQVAEHLSLQARALTGDDADAFGRSAFNRYYYATYLSVRELLASLDSSWETQPHSAIPNLLETTVMRLVRDQAKRMSKSGLLTEAKQHSLAKQAGRASSDIASVLRVAYGVRVVADYRPDQRVGFQHAEFRLAEHSQTEARKWKMRVDRSKGVLMNISKELGIVV